MVLATAADAVVALGRISKFLTAEELAVPYTIDPDSKFAIDVEGDFAWETAYKAEKGDSKFSMGSPGKHGPPDRGKGGEKKRESRTKNSTQPKAKRSIFGRKRKTEGPVLPTSTPTESPIEGDSTKPDDTKNADEKPFELTNLKVKVPNGSFVAIVGPIGSGKVILDLHVLCCSVLIHPLSEFPAAGLDRRDAESTGESKSLTILQIGWNLH